MNKILIALSFLIVSSLAWGMRVSKFQMAFSPITVTNADVFTGPTTLQQDYGYAVQAIWTGSTLAGTISLQATIDGIDWSTITGTPQTVNGPGSFVWNVDSSIYDQVRVYFTYGSGSGGITVWQEVKGP